MVQLLLMLVLLAAVGDTLAQKGDGKNEGGSRPPYDPAAHCWPPSSCPSIPGQGGEAPRHECAETCECCLCVSEGASLDQCEKRGLDCACFVGEGQPGPCDDLSARTDEVNMECCDEAAERCVAGAPAVCNHGCARVFLRFYEDCAWKMGPQSEVFDPVVSMCERTERAAGVAFDGSQIIDSATGTALDNWIAGMGATDPETRPLETWELCYSSFTDDTSSAEAFHRQCDAYGRSVVVARTASGAVFGGYTTASWGFEECCANRLNGCHATQADSYCEEHAAAVDSFIFGTPAGASAVQKFETMSRGSTEADRYIVCGASRWPEFGRRDLILGRGDGPPGASGVKEDAPTCRGGEVYGAPGCDTLHNCHLAGSGAVQQGSICGEDGADWGQLDLEVWVMQGE
eukprot:COSAG02_NODE_201_length_29473_cov_135.510213_7_plen_402_part_00